MLDEKPKINNLVNNLENNANYLNYTIYEITNFNIAKLDIEPYKNKLFNNDIFSIDENDNISIVHSILRSSLYISGVLVIENNQYITKNNVNYYKCIADDVRLPVFYIPYEIDLSQSLTNLYIIFSYLEWTDNPYGIITQVIGPIDIINNFYEYKLYCKTLNSSISKFQTDTNNALEKYSPHEIFIDKIMEKYPNIENRTEWYVFTIDCNKSFDYDDAIGIRYLDNDTTMLSIYISNVSVIIDVLNLWNSFSKRISNIYLPDKKRPMFPSVLCECLCSLLENHNRVAFTMDVYIQNDDIIDIKYSNCLISVNKNYEYEEPELLNNRDYRQLFNITKMLSRKYKYITNLRTSHGLISYLMVFMNYQCATEMIKHKNGIFRSTILKRDTIVPDNVPEDVSKFIKNWYNSCGNYVNGTELMDEEKNVRHNLLDLDSYIHISSPNRRLPDLLNIIQFQENNNIIKLSENAIIFYDRWVKKLDYINTTMRSIRKIQIDCTLLDICINDPDILNKEYDGYLFDRIVRNDGLYQYMIYILELKLSSRINLREKFDNFEMKKFKLFLYDDNFKRKIRLHLSNNLEN